MEHFLLQLLMVCSSVVQVSTFQLVLVSGFFPSAFPHAWHILVWGTTLKTSHIPGTLKEGINGPLSLQSYVSDMMVCNPLVRQVHVHSFTTQEWSMINSEH